MQLKNKRMFGKKRFDLMRQGLEGRRSRSEGMERQRNPGKPDGAASKGCYFLDSPGPPVTYVGLREFGVAKSRR